MFWRSVTAVLSTAARQIQVHDNNRAYLLSSTTSWVSSSVKLLIDFIILVQDVTGFCRCHVVVDVITRL